MTKAIEDISECLYQNWYSYPTPNNTVFYVKVLPIKIVDSYPVFRAVRYNTKTGKWLILSFQYIWPFFKWEKVEDNPKIIEKLNKAFTIWRLKDNVGY